MTPCKCRCHKSSSSKSSSSKSSSSPPPVSSGPPSSFPDIPRLPNACCGCTAGTVPQCWQLLVAGVSPGTGPYAPACEWCDDYNGLFILRNTVVGSSCAWVSDEKEYIRNPANPASLDCSGFVLGTQPRWTFTCNNTTGIYTVAARMPVIPSTDPACLGLDQGIRNWTYDETEAFSCMGNNRFTRPAYGNVCNCFVPLYVYVEPGPC
jgi:hypothetical protein